MKILTAAIALTIAFPAYAQAQQPAEADHDAMSCCEHDADGNMTHCRQMNGEGGMAMTHGAMPGMDHQGMAHHAMPDNAMNDAGEPASGE